ncbi:YfbM family protein [Thiothrix nivea]|uniref:DUF1877 domain-containing protein n=1 Tax=Thiothrix nivea (strain ATCC 35100 / DSM 5205 / JP2) TaxID=870187 RepID=A0A656HCH7_THINJ|nr:YfbM family protein [Thiothrix nivea]EIJ33146.1 protein of unknown function DUF1877 [Thiothrix nivea DSM 5205]
MGVCLHLAAISDANIECLGDNPSLIWTLVQNEQPGTSNTSERQQSTRKTLYPEPIHLRETLGEYWHGIHYLLCGQAWNGQFPTSFLLDGGSYVGDVDIGYGPARLFDSCETRKIARNINRKTPADLAKHFDALQMLDEDVYPGLLWDEDTGALNACLERFTAMQHFLRHAAENELGFTLYLTNADI